VDRNATCTALIADFGGGFVRGESLSRLVGEGSRSEMFSINPVEGTREIDQRTLQDHVAPHASSDLLYLNALDDKSRTIFAGLIKVEPGAKGTDAYQKVKNLILSDDADPNSMPGLEILNDEVRCTHGATNGPVRRGRALLHGSPWHPEEKARRLIVNGFFNSLLERLENQSVPHPPRNPDRRKAEDRLKIKDCRKRCAEHQSKFLFRVGSPDPGGEPIFTPKLPRRIPIWAVDGVAHSMPLQFFEFYQFCLNPNPAELTTERTQPGGWAAAR
jgi:hypothetical protein